MRFQFITKWLAALGCGPVARDTLLSIGVRLATLALGFLVAIFTARLLGPEGYGTVAVALSVTMIAATVATMGFGPLAVREVARLRVRSDWPDLQGFLRFSGLAVAGASLLAGLTMAALALGTGLFERQFTTEIAIASILVLPSAMLLLLRGVLQGFGQVLAAQMPGDLVRPGLLVMYIGLIFATGVTISTTGYLILVAAAAIPAMLLAILFLTRSVRSRVPAAAARFRARFWSRSSVSFLVIILLGVLGTEVITLLLGWLAGPTEAGLFQPIARITPIMMIVTEALAMPLGPRIAAHWERHDLDGIRDLYRRATRFATFGTIIIVAGMILAAPLILTAFGGEFLVNEHLFIWIGVAQIVNASMGMAAQLLAMTGAMRLRILAQSLTLLAQFGLGLVLIGPFGAEGAAGATVGAILVWSTSHWLFAKVALGIDTSLLAARPTPLGSQQARSP